MKEKSITCKKPHIAAWGLWNIISKQPVNQALYVSLVLLEKFFILYAMMVILARVLDSSKDESPFSEAMLYFDRHLTVEHQKRSSSADGEENSRLYIYFCGFLCF